MKKLFIAFLLFFSIGGFAQQSSNKISIPPLKLVFNPITISKKQQDSIRLIQIETQKAKLEQEEKAIKARKE